MALPEVAVTSSSWRVRSGSRPAASPGPSSVAANLDVRRGVKAAYICRVNGGR
jgi:hypothetical protein